MRGIISDDAVSGSFEELPALLVVLVAISLFSVSVAQAAMSLDDSDEYISLQEDSATFAGMVASSPALCAEGRSFLFDPEKIHNLSHADMGEFFNSTLLGFEYRIIIQCLDTDSGNITSESEYRTSEPLNATDIACFNTCVNVLYPDRTGAARLSVAVWRP